MTHDESTKSSNRPTNTVVGHVQNGFLARMMRYSPPAVCVWLALANRVNDRLECYPSLTMIQADTGLVRSTVHKAIGELVKAGEIERSSGGGKGNPSNLYRITGSPRNELVRETNQSKIRTKVVRETDKGSTGNGPKPNKETKRRNQTKAVAIPASLKSEKFLLAWNDFKKHRQEKRATFTPTAERRSLAKLEKMGVDRAVAALEHSMANGWVGIFEPSNNGNGRLGRAPIGPGQVHKSDHQDREDIGVF